MSRYTILLSGTFEVWTGGPWTPISGSTPRRREREVNLNRHSEIPGRESVFGGTSGHEDVFTTEASQRR